MNTHASWDRGVIKAAIDGVLGMATPETRKTVKAYCGKTVKVDRINDGGFDCPDCAARVRADEESSAELRRILDSDPAFRELAGVVRRPEER